MENWKYLHYKKFNNFQRKNSSDLNQKKGNSKNFQKNIIAAACLKPIWNKSMFALNWSRKLNNNSKFQHNLKMQIRLRNINKTFFKMNITDF